jgi:hypothetical protein
VYGYYPTDVNDDQNYDEGELFNSPGDMHVDNMQKFNAKYEWQDVTAFSLNLTEGQQAKLLQQLNKYVTEPGTYSLAGRNCTSVAVDAMYHSGIKIGGVITERGYGLQSGYLISPSNLSGILSSPANRELITKITRFTVGH